MLRMHHVGGIVVTACMLKIVGTVAMLMDMKAEKYGFSWRGNVWEAEHLCFHERTAIRCVIKFDKSADSWMVSISTYPGHGPRLVLRELVYKSKSGSWL